MSGQFTLESVEAIKDAEPCLESEWEGPSVDKSHGAMTRVDSLCPQFVGVWIW